MKLYDSIKPHFKPTTEAMQSYIKRKHEERIEKYKREEKSKAKFSSHLLFSHFYYFGDWQIICNYTSRAKVFNRRKDSIIHNAVEINRWCYNVKTHKVIHASLNVNCCGRDFDFMSEMKPFNPKRGYNYYSTKNHYAELSGDVIPGSKLHPEITKRGINIPFIRKHTINQVKDYIVNVMKDPFKETLMKSCMWRLATREIKQPVRHALKLCLRNKIEIQEKDLHTFADAINLMEQYHVDWHNKKYLADWEHLHDRLIEKRNEENDREIMMKALEYNDEFIEKHKAWLGIFWTENDLKFKTLNSVKEYFEEGNTMHHCVGKCEYFKKEDVVIFSISCNDIKIATLEYDTKENKILQLRAKCNKTPERYTEITSIFEKHIKQYNKAV